MSKEGELCKKISELYNNASPESGDWVTDFQIEKILDEVKKDLYSVIDRMEKESDNSSNNYIYSYQRLIEKIKKWLGGSE